MNDGMQKTLLGAAGALVALALWQVVAMMQLLGSALPTATDSLSRLGLLLVTSDTWQAIGETLLTALIGLLIAIVLGVVLGVLIGTLPVLEHATRVVLEFLKPIPAIVILPIAVLVLGPSIEMGVFLVMYSCGLQMLVQTATGVLNTDPVALDTARSFGMNRLERLWRIVLPSTTPEIVTGIRIAAPTALIVAIVAELFGGAPGLGQELYLAMKVVDREGIFGIVILLGLLGFLVLWSTSAAADRIIHWHSSVREGSKS